MSANGVIWFDGEKIPDDRIRDIFQPPPLVPSRFYRSALIVGSKGAGKTTLFRYHKEIHDGIALHISLATEFASLTKQTALGPLASEYPSDDELLILGKATSLLAISIAERLARKGLPPPVDLLMECIPPEMFPSEFLAEDQWCSAVKAKIARSKLELFGGISQSRPLPRLVACLGEACEKHGRPLLLLLDRADMVPPAALIPAVEMLDQSSGYIALVATRPGHAGATIARLAGQAVPGDHYDFVQLGVYPRSDDWIIFVRSAIVAQLGQAVIDSLTQDIQARAITIARDSLRTALELFARAAAGLPLAGEDNLLSAIEDSREKHLVAVQQTLRPYHPDFRDLVNSVREQVLSEGGPIRGPVVLSIQPRVPDSLFDTAMGVPRFIEASLRSGALCMPEGQRWIPDLQPTELEVPPLFLWRKGDLLWTGKETPPHRITRPESSVLRVTRGGAAESPSIFIAYRMKFEESQHFRKSIEEKIRLHPSLSHWRVVDGHVPSGANWADVIRRRIKGANAVVGDVTGMRPDVLFELGFAFGLCRHIIPVVCNPGDRGTIPFWLGAKQFGYYNDTASLARIVSSIEALFFDPQFAKTPESRPPVPSLAVWVRVLEWNRTASEQFVTTAERDGLKVEVLGDDTPDEILLRRATSAALLAVSLDGTARDGLAHYMCGAVLAHPKAGYGKQLPRTIIILEPPGHRQGSFVAESIARCQETVRIIRLEEVAGRTAEFGRTYQHWGSTASKRPRK